jgi:hypothetical protein
MSVLVVTMAAHEHVCLICGVQDDAHAATVPASVSPATLSGPCSLQLHG